MDLLVPNTVLLGVERLRIEIGGPSLGRIGLGADGAGDGARGASAKRTAAL